MSHMQCTHWAFDKTLAAGNQLVRCAYGNGHSGLHVSEPKPPIGATFTWATGAGVAVPLELARELCYQYDERITQSENAKQVETQDDESASFSCTINGVTLDVSAYGSSGAAVLDAVDNVVANLRAGR